MTTPRRLLLAVAALLATAGGFVLLTRDREAPAASDPQPAAIATSPVERMSRPRAVRADESTAQPVEVPDEPADEPSGPQRVLRLLDGRGEPLAGVWTRGEGGSGFTDERGEKSYDATEKPLCVRFFDGEMERTVDLVEPVTEVRLAGVRTLAVGIVDGSTGAPLPGVRWGSSARSWHHDRSFDASALGLPLDDDFRARACVRVEPPEGFGALDAYEWEGPVADRAKSVRLVVPVFPAREILFRTVDAEGRAVAGAEVVWADTRLAGDFNPTNVTHRAARSDATGLLRIEGLPRVPFARLSVHVARVCEDDDSFELGATAEDIVLDEAGSPEPVKLVVTRQERSFRGGSGAGSGSACGSPYKPDVVAPLVVRVLYRDGTPAARVTVVGADVAAVTDREGRIRFDAVRTGVADFSAYAHGFVATAVRVDVGHDGEIVIRESAPRTVRVLVQDASGRALPAARVTATCVNVPGSSLKPFYVQCSVAQLTGDEELATPLTGGEGTVELSVPVGTIEYRVTLGAARAEVESADEFVRIVLRAPKD